MRTKRCSDLQVSCTVRYTATWPLRTTRQRVDCNIRRMRRMNQVCLCEIFGPILEKGANSKESPWTFLRVSVGKEQVVS